MKSLTALVCSLINEVGAASSTNVERDLKTVTSRVEGEGESFLTITLPAFSAAFERALDTGSIASVSFPGFRKRGGFPLFLGGILRLVFDSERSGALLESPSIEAIRGIRQITLVTSKIFEVCDERRAAQSIDGFVECERLMNEYWFDPGLLRELRRTATEVFGRELRRIDREISSLSIVPRHGPGATADRLSGNGKYDSLYWPSRLEGSFPSADFLLAGYSHFERLAALHQPEPRNEMPVRVICVPKTASKARVIAAEPANVQYCQQAILSSFSRAFSADHDFVCLDNQDLNRVMARRGSHDGSLATLDLSEASDRVGLAVVEAVFGDFPNLLAALTASRSLTASLPDGRVIRLSKFASMGSATCFPVESIVFATIALNAVRKQLSCPEWRRAIMNGGWLRGSLRVFGDDIIVPTRYVQSVLTDLVALATKPNSRKSFWTGKFRESCGGDYYGGEDVSVTRLRRRLPLTRRDSSELLGLISFRNQLYMHGFWSTVGLVDKWIKELVPLPIVEPSSPVVGRVSVAFGYQAQRYHPDYQVPLVKGLVVRSTSPKSLCSDHGKLLKCLLPGRSQPFEQVDHLTRSGRPDRVATRVGWATPY